MATYYSEEYKPVADSPARVPYDPALGGRVRLFRATIKLDAPALTPGTAGTIINSGDTVKLFTVPPGWRFVRGFLCTSVSGGSTTWAIGIAGTTGKYRAAATFTAVDTPTPFGPAQIMDDVALAAAEEILLTAAAANAPNGAGHRLIVDMEFAGP